MTITFEEISETFELLDDWEEKYRYIIELGRNYDALDETLRTDTLKIDGCASQVWLLPKMKDGKFYFEGASDAIIVSGLVSILSALYNGEEINKAIKINAMDEFDNLGLGANLSTQRSNGLSSMIKNIQTYLASTS
ncbi:MAG: SufE family protein [Amylibacter sp.]|jgi:cysteine desulfuration protein SufE|nr:SufE family protein [Amylibacter sp.]MDA8802895.1 SufE family protein [Amylibacter sp.]RZO40625.1 MAG: SufE family protein [Paracoccaceae bacterium]|tara:strand:- start:6107 stop:6514 length:408 start_codon:yes stop_codon:yes gene_type:complete